MSASTFPFGSDPEHSRTEALGRPRPYSMPGPDERDPRPIRRRGASARTARGAAKAAVVLTRWMWRALKALLRVVVVAMMLAALVATSAVLVTSRVAEHDPESTAFQRADAAPLQYDLPVEEVSRDFLVAVIAKEDQQFPRRRWFAFDAGDFVARAKEYVRDGGDSNPGGSTIDQQLAKNIWLSPERSALRKGAEAILASAMPVTMAQDRRLELYVNNVEFGPGIWGVCAASWYYYDKAPAMLTRQESAELVGALPSPKTFSRLPEGGMKYEPDGIVAWSKAHIDEKFLQVGEYKATTSIGITGWAEDLSYGCAEMPSAIKQRIQDEGGVILAR